MRWLALLMLCANVLVWYFAGAMQPPVRSSETVSGTLPRVASLKASSDQGVVSEPEEVEEIGVAEVAEEPGEVASTGPVSPEPVPLAPVPEERPLHCVRLGWLDSREAAQAIMEAVPALDDGSVTIEEMEQVRPPLNWVLIPPQPADAARKQFREIQRQGIDSYLVTQGEYRNAISLGLFESREAAISVLEEKKRQNLNAVLANYDRNQISYALDFEAEPDLAEDLVQAVTSEYGKNFDFIEINPCEGVATSEKTP